MGCLQSKEKEIPQLESNQISTTGYRQEISREKQIKRFLENDKNDLEMYENLLSDKEYISRNGNESDVKFEIHKLKGIIHILEQLLDYMYLKEDHIDLDENPDDYDHHLRYERVMEDHSISHTIEEM